MGAVRRPEPGLSRPRLAPDVTARVSVEQASTFGWAKLRRATDGEIIGMHTFGASAPLKDLLKKFGFSVEKVVDAARRQLSKRRR